LKLHEYRELGLLGVQNYDKNKTVVARVYDALENQTFSD